MSKKQPQVEGPAITHLEPLSSRYPKKTSQWRTPTVFGWQISRTKEIGREGWSQGPLPTETGLQNRDDGAIKSTSSGKCNGKVHEARKTESDLRASRSRGTNRRERRGDPSEGSERKTCPWRFRCQLSKIQRLDDPLDSKMTVSQGAEKDAGNSKKNQGVV